MKIKSIVTMDDELTFVDAEIVNIKNTKKLDKAIQQGKVVEIKENGKIYKLNSSYIMFYQP